MAIHPLDSSPPSNSEHIKNPTHPLTENISSNHVSPPPPASPSTQDTLDLTHEQAAYEAIQTKVAQLPDIRQERILEIQKALESGQYHVSSEDLADRLIEDTLLNKSHKEI